VNPIKILVFAGILVLILFLLQLILPPEIKQNILNSAGQLATTLPLYAFFKEEVLAGTLKGLSAYVAFANIPILPNAPVEPYVIFVFSKGVNPILIVLTVTGITAVTSSISYFLGYLFGPRLIEKLTGKPFSYSERMDFMSAPVTFVSHLLPVPNIFSFLFGAYQSDYKNFLTAVLLATAIRFTAALFIFHNYGNVLLQLPFMKLIS